MNIVVIGTGYVGLVAGACFAETGNDVVGADVDAGKIDGLKRNVLPIYDCTRIHADAAVDWITGDQ